MLCLSRCWPRDHHGEPSWVLGYGGKNKFILSISRAERIRPRRTHCSPTETPFFLIHVNETDANFRFRTKRRSHAGSTPESGRSASAELDTNIPKIGIILQGGSW
jgi:hypothetical protein